MKKISVCLNVLICGGVFASHRGSMLAEFDLRVDEMFGFSGRTQARFIERYPWIEKYFKNLMDQDDGVVKLACDNLGMYAYAKARRGECWTKEFMEGFAYRFERDSKIVENECIISRYDRRLMMRYARFCYGAGMEEAVLRARLK